MIHNDVPVNEQLSKSNIYIGYGSNAKKLTVNNEKELALYFPYIACVMASSPEGRTYQISSTDYIRETEIDRVRICVDDARKEINRLRRYKLPVTVKNVYERRFSWSLTQTDRTEIEEIIRRKIEERKPTFDDIRLMSCDFYREIWFDDLVNIYGYDKDFAKDWVWHLNEFV